MIAVYKKELRARGLYGWLYALINLAAFGGLSWYYNIAGGYGSAASVVQYGVLALIFAVPLLTADAFACERRLGTDKLMRSLPLSGAAVVWGKYLAALVPHFFTSLVLCLYPLAVSALGGTEALGVLGAIGGYFLLGAALIALGILVAYLADNRWIAFFATAALLLALACMPFIADWLATAPRWGAAALFAVFGALAYLLTRQALAALLIGFAFALPPLLGRFLPFIDEGWVMGYYARYLGALGVFDGLAGLLNGVFDLSVLIRWLLAALFLVGLAAALAGRGGFKKRLAFAAVALVLVVAANGAVGYLPAALRCLDTSEQGLITPSGESKALLEALNQDVTISYVRGEGEDGWLSALLTRYAAESPRITVRALDVSQAPLDETGAALAVNDVVVAGPARATTIAAATLYEYEYAYNYYTGGYAVANATYVAEDKIVNALRYATAENVTEMYLLTDGGAQALGAGVTRQLGEDFVACRPLSLGEAEIPADAAYLLLYGPTEDISAAAAKKLEAYLAGGGRFVLMTNYDKAEFPNLDALMRAYGMEAEGGMVIEGDANYYYSADYPYYLKPILSEHAATAAALASGMGNLAPMCHALRAVAAEGVQVSPLMATSEAAYMFPSTAVVASLERTDECIGGPFTLAMTAEKGDARLAWLASTQILDDSVDQGAGFANSRLFADLLNWMAPLTERTAIAGKSLMGATLNLDGNMRLALYGLAVVPTLLCLLALLLRKRRRR